MRRGVLSILVISLAAWGCATPRKVATGELARLHRWEDATVIRDVQGREIPFTRQSRLELVLVGGEVIAHRYSRIEVIRDVFHGTVDGSGAKVEVALKDVEFARVGPAQGGEPIPVVLMVVTMWLLVGVLALIGWAVVEHADLDDADVDVIVISH